MQFRMYLFFLTIQAYKSISHSEPEGLHPFQSVTHSSTCQENTLQDQLCQGAPKFLQLGKTLTPMHKAIRKHSWDDNSHERITKMKLSQISQSTPGLSNPHSVGKLNNLVSEKGCFGKKTAFLTEDMPKCIASSSSAANIVDQPDIEGFVLRENRESELFQVDSGCNKDHLSNKLQALLHRRDYLSNEIAPKRTSAEQLHHYSIQGESELEYKSQNLTPWDIFSPGSPSYPPLSDMHHLTTQHSFEYNTQCVHNLDNSQCVQSQQSHPETSLGSTSTMIPVTSPIDMVEQATDEVVTTFDYDSDESNHASETTSDDSIVVRSSVDTVAGGSVSPWHDKNRKIRINPPRVLKVSTQFSTTSESSIAGHIAISSSVDIATEKDRDRLRPSRSCSEINPGESPDTESVLLHTSQVSHNSSIDTASERVE